MNRRFKIQQRTNSLDEDLSLACRVKSSNDPDQVRTCESSFEVQHVTNSLEEDLPLACRRGRINNLDTARTCESFPRDSPINELADEEPSLACRVTSSNDLDKARKCEPLLRRSTNNELARRGSLSGMPRREKCTTSTRRERATPWCEVGKKLPNSFDEDPPHAGRGMSDKDLENAKMCDSQDEDEK